MSLQAKLFSVEEYHRGDWQEVLSKDKDGKRKPKRVRITQYHADLLSEQAEAQVRESNKTNLFRYVELKETVIEKATDEQDAKQKEMWEHAENDQVSNQATNEVGNQVEKGDEDLKLSELRAKYPNIKDTSKEGFLKQVRESK